MARLQATAEAPGWNTFDLGSRFVDFKIRKADRGRLPAPARIRNWNLADTTLTRSATVHAGCLIRRGHELRLIFEPC